MAKQRSPLARLAGSLWAGAAAALLGWIVTQTPFWRHVELRLYDQLVVRSAPNRVELPITIVGIDEATYAELKASWPLPRRYHARVLEALREAGAAVVGFDITFPDATDARDDKAFATAIGRFGRVALASDLVFREDAAVRQWSRVDPHPMFLAAGASKGYAALEVDDDAVLRRVPTVGDAFWRVLLAEFDTARPGVVEELDADEATRIRYVGAPHTFTYVPYHFLLDPGKHMPPNWREFLRDNIVLVGRNLNVIGDVGAAQAEMYQTPFFSRTREFMPRVEAHANVVANMASGMVLREAPAAHATFIWALAVLLALYLMRLWHPWQSGAVLLVLLVLLAAGEYAYFTLQQTWLPAAGALMTVTLIYLAQGAVAFFSEQRQRREMRGAFSMYVSPQLVDEVIAHPERLRLGGERRMLTILFSDLAGFTTISERLDPEQVSALVNRHLSDMTDAIQVHSGTVQKFLGDGIMAFWGAPVPDERQAERSVRAALEMQRRVREMEVVDDTGARLRMRVGINRGECIVGNMGGNNRFDYTAVGDPVNLAARLEGVNKMYGTGILVSGTVVSEAGSALRFREIDTVRVKGKLIGIRIFSPCDDEALVALSDRALAAYRAKNFTEAERAWRELLVSYPSDPVAETFLARLEEFGDEGLPEGWDGIHTLDTK